MSALGGKTPKIASMSASSPSQAPKLPTAELIRAKRPNAIVVNSNQVKLAKIKYFLSLFHREETQF